MINSGSFTAAICVTPAFSPLTAHREPINHHNKNCIATTYTPQDDVDFAGVQNAQVDARNYDQSNKHEESGKQDADEDDGRNANPTIENLRVYRTQCLTLNKINMGKDNNPILGILGLIAGLYAISTQIMTLYFWWQMAKEDNFFITFVIDPFIAEFKGILWPFFL